jgi:hypothetical protein
MAKRRTFLNGSNNMSMSYKYYAVIGKVSGLEDYSGNLMTEFPNEFLYELKKDSFLSEKWRFEWMEKLFNETYREKHFFERQAAYANRPKLSDENLLDVHIAIIKEYYANLSQMAKGHHPPGKVVNFLSIPKTKERIEKLLDVIALIPDTHEDYSEIQFIAAHLNYLKNPKGKEWKTHFNLCADADPQHRWVKVSEKKSDYEETVEMLKAYAQLNKATDAQDQKENLHQKALKQVGDNSKSLSPLLRLSLLTEEREKRQHYLISLKAVDENFMESREWIECLKTDKVIDEEKEKEFLESMNQLGHS